MIKKSFRITKAEESIEPEDVDLSSFELKDELNGDFWETGKLDIYARRALLRIARDFVEEIDLDDMPIVDVAMTGSLANYNWNEEYSDIDLHIITNYKKISKNVELVKDYFDATCKKWNQNHEGITIYGYPVELYVQDENEPHTSTGVYSVLKDKWNIKPSRKKIENDDIDYNKIKKTVSDFVNEVDDLEEEMNNLGEDGEYEEYMDIYERVGKVMKHIKKERKSELSASKGKEMSDGNLIFKTLRRNGCIAKIIDIKKRCYNMANSL